MKNLKKRALKFIGLQVAVLIALTVIQIGIQYAQTHRYIGFVDVTAKDTWYSVAMTAQAYNSTCQIDLDKANAQLEDFRKLRDEE